MSKKYNMNTMNGIRTFVPGGSNAENRKSFSPWYMSIFEVVEVLNTNTEKGLSLQEAQKRRKKTGLNLLYPEFKRSFKSALVDHVKSVISILFTLSLFVFYLFSQDSQYFISATIVFISILFDCIIEHIASVKLSNSRKSASLKAYVRRNGALYSVDSRHLVPGDVVFLQKGSIVPADIRLFDTNGLVVLETPINSSEKPINKIAKDIFGESDYSKETPVNMAYAGSIVNEGSGWGIVCFTGVQTRFTKVPKNKHSNVPALFKYVYSVTSMLSIISAFLGAFMLVSGLFFSSFLAKHFLFTLTVAVCSLCDSVVSFSALSFSNGLSEMKKNGAVLRNMSAIEEISFLDTILAHQNTLFPIQKTELESVFVGTDIVDGNEKQRIIKYYLLCSDIKKQLSKKGENGLFFEGKQNTVAAALYAESVGLNVDSVKSDFLVTEVRHVENNDFSSLLAYENGQKYLFLKGEARDVLPLCKYHYTINGLKTLTPDNEEMYEDFILSNTNETGYLIAVAKCETAIDKLSEYENRKVLTLCGFIKFKTYFGINYLKEVFDFENSKIDICMFSSDAYLKAYNLGKNSGIFQKNSQVITEEELRYMSADEFESNLPSYRLFLNFSSTLFNKILVKKRKDGEKVGVSAESTDDLKSMKNSNVSFVVDSESSEMIKQASDVILSAGGFDKIGKVIFTSKKVYRRIHSICEYFVYNYSFALFLYILGVVFNLQYRIHDFVIPFVLCSSIIAFFLSTVPISQKQNYSKPFKRKTSVSPLAYINSYVLGFLSSVFCVILSFAFKNVSSYSVSLICCTLLSFFSAIIILNDGEPFYKKFLGFNVFSLIPLFILSLIVASLILFTNVSSLFGYSIPSMASVVTSVIVSFGVFVVSPYLLKSINKIIKK